MLPPFKAAQNLLSRNDLQKDISHLDVAGNVKFGTKSGKLTETIQPGQRRVGTIAREDDESDLDLPEGEPVSEGSEQSGEQSTEDEAVANAHEEGQLWISRGRCGF